MANYFPQYSRGESLTGYSSRCSASRELINAVPSPSARWEMCKEFATEMRKVMNQPFSKETKQSP